MKNEENQQIEVNGRARMYRWFYFFYNTYAATPAPTPATDETYWFDGLPVDSDVRSNMTYWLDGRPHEIA